MKTRFVLGALLALAPCAMLASSPANARQRHSNAGSRHYKTFVGRDGRTYCRKSDGTTGAIIGGVAGGVIGHEVAGRGDRTLGTLLGAGLGVVGGRAIERRRRTRCG
ncbi:glycine zipper 2TM domain-containing protein [Novosphingobium sp. Chol11]|uniref:glycine zipper 2TM domain-containing protein n=1 Tax=Novosphingobium sp. Chol11 TaxID=1385763 RepID=UPI0025D958D5|nr:glycine zipper 2TM domain-containing protein [Novosphingobium sp. Chol11]